MLSSIKAYFNMSKWESIALLVLCAVLFLLVGINYSMPLWVKSPSFSNSDSIALQKLAVQIHTDSSNQTTGYRRYEKYIAGDGSKIHGFNFDPNTLDSNGFIRLGLSAKTAHDIINYRNHGAVFYNKQKFATVYSLSEAEYKKLAPFISIAPTKNKYTNNYTPREKTIIEINSADTALFNKLYGIGPVLAMRIVELRTQLGGFYSIAQLQEVYGITDSTMQKIKPQLRIDASKISKIHINTVLYQTLNEHPYFKNGLALAIIKYRKSHANKIETLDDIKNIEGINIIAFNKAMHYLDVK